MVEGGAGTCTESISDYGLVQCHKLLQRTAPPSSVGVLNFNHQEADIEFHSKNTIAVKEI